jgi:hypothetical protein
MRTSWLAALTAVAAFAAYAVTLHPSVPGGDSGELITAAAVLGVAHPPGYPLYTMLGHLWMSLLPLASPAREMNLLSAILAAAAVGTIVATARRVTGSIWAALAAGGVLAFSPPLWKNAVVAEVFALHALLVAATLCVFVRVLADAQALRPPARPWPLAALAFLATLSLSHHHTLVLLMLPVASITAALVLLPESRRRAWLPGSRAPYALGARDGASIGIAAITGLLPLLYLPWAAARDPVLAWGDPRTPARLFHLVTRADYGTFRLDPAAAGHVADRSHVLLYLESLARDFSIVGLVLVVLGLGLIAARRRALAWAIGAYLLLQMLFFARIGFPSVPPIYRGVVERFYVMPDVVLALALAFGAAAALDRLPHRARVVLGVALAALAWTWPPIAHARLADQRGNRSIEDLGMNVLTSTPPGAVLFVQGDVFHNTLAYLIDVEHRRPDVTLIDQEMLTFVWSPPVVRRRAPDALPRLGPDDRYDGSPATGTLRWLDHLAGHRPAAFVGLKDTTYAERYEMVPRGYVLEPYPRGQAPDLRARADTALALFERLRTDAWFRAQDPWSFEAENRWRFSELAARTALLLCDPVNQDARLARRPGFAKLVALIDRHRAGVDVDPDLLRAGGMLFALHPGARDPAKARADLARYLVLEPAGWRSDEARDVLRYLGPGSGPSR